MNVIPFVAFIRADGWKTVAPRSKHSKQTLKGQTQRDLEGYGYVDNEQDWMGSTVAVGDSSGVRHRCIGNDEP